MNLVIGPPVPAPVLTETTQALAPGDPPPKGAGPRRSRVPRSATTEQTPRLRAAIQGAFDAAEASLRR